jgi:hypothetical protein
MVRHEAVRKKRKVVPAGGTQKLSQYDVDVFAIREVPTSLERAEREEIPEETGVVETFQACRMARVHDVRLANHAPVRLKPDLQVRLKPDATDAGPAAFDWAQARKAGRDDV